MKKYIYELILKNIYEKIAQTNFLNINGKYKNRCSKHSAE